MLCWVTQSTAKKLFPISYLKNDKEDVIIKATYRKNRDKAKKRKFTENIEKTWQ